MRRWSYFRNFRPIADLRGHVQRTAAKSPICEFGILLRALAAQNFLHLRKTIALPGSGKPDIHARRSKTNPANSQTADKVSFPYEFPNVSCVPLQRASSITSGVADHHRKVFARNKCSHFNLFGLSLLWPIEFDIPVVVCAQILSRFQSARRPD